MRMSLEGTGGLLMSLSAPLMSNSLTPRINDGRHRRVVFHADDFGMNEAINRGIVRGFTHGLLTSTSLLSNAPHAIPALVAWQELLRDQRAGLLPSAEARRRLLDADSSFDLGVHLNLTQGRPLTPDSYPDELLNSEGCFPGIGRLFGALWRVRRLFEPLLFLELSAQIERLLDSDVAPTHLNGHQYIETLPGIAPLIPRLAQKYGIPVVRVAQERRLWRTTLLRGEISNWGLSQIKRLFATRFLRQMDQSQLQHPAAFFGTSHAGRINLNLIRLFLESMPVRKDCLIEIGLHPAVSESDDQSIPMHDGWHDPLANFRPHELSLLTSPELVEFLEQSHIRLGRLGELAPNTLKAAA